MLTSKQDSPVLNPAIQLGSGISVVSILGRSTGIILGIASINIWDKPLFIDALILIIFSNPSIVICSLWAIKSTTVLNSSKSARFCESKGYLSK